MTREIQLTKGQIALVDDEDFERINQHKWKAQWNKCTNSFYATRSVGNYSDKDTIMMHREVMDTPKGLLCDHINHDTLDNQKHNLRNITHSQNQMNRRGAQSNNELGEKGIYKIGSQFRVRVKVNRKVVFEKNFNTLESAISVRDRMVSKYHGEFGKVVEQ